MLRIAVVGVTGSGKKTLAQALSQRLALPHLELDSIYWGPVWTPVPLEKFRAHVETVTRGERWTIDGNYREVRDLVWGRADTLVWLNYPLPLIFWRLTQRTFQRIIEKEVLWNGNRERLRDFFFSRDSLYLWALKSARKHAAEYPKVTRQPEYQHLNVVRLRSPREMERWLAGVGAS